MAASTFTLRLTARSCGCSGLCACRASAGRRAASGRRSVAVFASKKEAVVVLTGTSGVAGTVTFTQDGDGARPACRRPQPLKFDADDRRSCVALFSGSPDTPWLTNKNITGATTVKGKITGLKAGQARRFPSRLTQSM